MTYRTLSLILSLSACVALHAAGQMDFGMAGPEVQHETALEYSAIHPGETTRGATRFSLSSGWHVNAHEPLDEYLIPTVLSISTAEGFTLEGVAYPEHSLYTFSFSPEPLAVYDEVFVIGFVLRASETAAPGEYALTASLRYQACDDRMCAPPRTLSFELPVTVAAPEATPERTAPDWFDAAHWPGLRSVDPTDAPAPAPVAEGASADAGDWQALADQFEITGRLAGYANTRAFLDFLDTAAEPGAAVALTTARSWWWLILVVLGGGLLLNLTPCVLPLIPINIAIIGAGARAGSRSRGMALGASYGLGIASVYGALGLVVVLGLSTAFGVINATAWFNGLIAALFVVLALAMFDIIQIDFSTYQSKLGVRGGGRGRFLAALGMGAVSALLAGACVAPVVIYTILQAQDLYSQGNMFALALPFGLGVGMALPWPFLGAGLSLLPKPGKWMTRVKQAFGVSILLFAVYYGHLAYTLAAPAALTDAEEDGVWVRSLERGLRQALDEDRPVLIDFWATWCKNCLVMDRTVLRDEEVLFRLEDHVKIKYQAEALSESPVKDVVAYFEVLGLPTFIVMEPKG